MTAYLDWAATAIPDPEIYRRAAEKAAEAWANPSSQHREGKKAAESLENARRLCASVLGVPPETVFFTSGGTEADQIPLLSLLRRPAPGSAVISAIEHPAVRNQAEVLKKFGWTILPVNPDADGFITPEAVLAAIREDTAFAAVMCVNNETGAIQPVEEIAAALPELPLEKLRRYTGELGISAQNAHLLYKYKAVCDFFDSCIAQGAGPGLPAAGQGQAVLPGAADLQRHPQPGAFPPDEGFVRVGRGPPQLVVDMAGGHLHLQPPGQGQQDAQQGHAVRPARDGGGHPLPMRKKPGLLAPGKHPGLGIPQKRRVVRSHGSRFPPVGRAAGPRLSARNPRP